MASRFEITRPWTAYGAVTLQGLVSAGTYLIAKRALRELEPLEIAWIRFVAAALLFAVILVAMRKPLAPPRGQRAHVLALGILGLPINQGLFLVGLAYTVPTHAAIMYALTPVAVLLGARLLLGERVTFARAVGVAIALVGVALVLVARGLAAERGPLIGDVLILVAMLAWTGYTLLTRSLVQQHGATAVTGWAMIAGGLVSAPFGPWVMRHPAELAHVSRIGWGAVVYLVLATSCLSYFLWAYGLRRLPASKVAVFSNLQPVETALLAWAITGERITASAALGGVLVMLGVAVSQRK